jgi:hypothetical protein
MSDGRLADRPSWTVLGRVAIWVLRIGKQEIPGRWVIMDGEFRPAE